MGVYPQIKFMVSPSATAAVRYDSNIAITSGSASVLHEGFDLGAPALEGDPDGIGVEYGLRTIHFTQRIEGTQPNALAKQSALARELLRQDNWLMVKIAADRDPVWFHTYRADPGSLSFENANDDPARRDLWDIVVECRAEPFAYGERETLSPITIQNDPAHASNPVRAVLPTILGDAPAPLRIEVNPSNSAMIDGRRLMFSLLSTNTAPTTPVVWQVGGVDGWTAGADTAASSADATMSGGTRRVVSFSTTPGMATRLSGQAPTGLQLGTYKVLVRIARSDTTSTFALRLGQLVQFSYFYGDTVTMERDSSTGTGHATWIDLGTFTHPRDHVVPEGVTIGSPSPNIALDAQRISGSGSMYIDAFLVVPIDIDGTRDCSTLFAEFPVVGIGGSSAYGVFDGDSELIWGYNGFGFAEAGLSAELMGRFPIATPGVANVLHFLQQVNARKPFFSSDASDDITVNTVLNISYYPRWLWIGEG